MTTPSLNNETHIITRIAAGDQHAFTQFFEHYQPIIYTYILRLSGSEMLSQEIVQDTFLKTWLKREKLTQLGNVGGWLGRIAANLTYDALRKQNTDRKRLEEVKTHFATHEAPETFTPTEVMIIEEQYAELLDEAVKTLPKRQLEAFQLIKIERLTREQAAARMGISPESVKTNLAVALQKIRAYCTQRMGAIGLLLFLWSSR